MNAEPITPEHDFELAGIGIIEIEEAQGFRWYAFSIEPAAHRFPSVTTVLGWTFRKPEWCRYDLTAEPVVFARKVGTAVHKAAEILAKGFTLKERTLEKTAVAPRVEQFRRFLQETGFHADASEVRLVSGAYGYGGRLDLVGFFRGSKTCDLLDITISEDTWLKRFQTAAYLQLWRELSGDKRPARRFALVLGTESYKLQEMPAAGTDFQIFLSALNCFGAAKGANAL